MRILLIVNSSASSVTARGRVVIQKALAADHEVTLAETTRRGNATPLAASAAANGTDVVVVLGGDGTLNEAANGLVGTDCALAPLPGGSTNVFARTLGLPNDPVEATGVLLDALDAGSIRRVDLGTVNGRAFLFHTGVGFDAAVVREVEKRSTLKRWAGHPLFIWATVKTWAGGYDRRRAHIHLPTDGGAVADGFFTLVLNTDPYTFLGNRPLHITDEAGLDRPLAVVTLRTLRVDVLLRVVAGALGAGRAVTAGRHVDVRTGVRDLTITSDVPVPYQVDGDYLGEATRLRFRHEPEALCLVVPRDRS